MRTEKATARRRLREFAMGTAGLPHKDGGYFATVIDERNIGTERQNVAIVHGITGEEATRRAELIVTAVNAYNDMLAVLNDMFVCMGTGEMMASPWWREKRERIWAAISKAEGK